MSYFIIKSIGMNVTNTYKIFSSVIPTAAIKSLKILTKINSFYSSLRNCKVPFVSIYSNYPSSHVLRWKSKPYRTFLPSFLLAFSIPFFRTTEEQEESEVIMIMKRAILASRKGEPEKAEQLLHLALKVAQETDDQQAITYIYDLMANFALQNEDYEKAETLFTDVLKRFLRAGMAEDDNAVVEVSLKLASILSNRGEFDKACEGFQFCIETQEKKLKSVGEENVDEDTLVLWAMSHDWFARFLMNLGHYERAQSHFSRAYDVCVTVKGAEDPQAAVLLNDIGSVLAMMEKYDEALEYLNRAVDIGKKIGSEDLASFYVNLGSVYLMKKVLENAEQNCNRGMKLARKNKDETTIQASEVCLDKLKQLRRS